MAHLERDVRVEQAHSGSRTSARDSLSEQEGKFEKVQRTPMAKNKVPPHSNQNSSQKTPITRSQNAPLRTRIGGTNGTPHILYNQRIVKAEPCWTRQPWSRQSDRSDYCWLLPGLLCIGTGLKPLPEQSNNLKITHSIQEAVT